MTVPDLREGLSPDPVIICAGQLETPSTRACSRLSAPSGTALLRPLAFRGG